MPNIKLISPTALRAMLDDGDELALIDLREELIYSRNHLLWARSVPLSRIELRFATLVPRRDTRIVLIDDNDGLATRAAAILEPAGYSDLSCLDGGLAAWDQAGLVLFSGMHVPSKAFGEFVEHDSGTPSLSADELNAMMQPGADMIVLDSRPFDEYSRISIPTGINVPGAELVLRVRDMVPSASTTIVVNCAGRTRSIIGAQSLINAGVPNKVMALRNGTMGWHLAGLKVAKGESDRFPNVTDTGLAWARPQAQAVADKFGVKRIDFDTLTRFRADTTRTTYLFDVREPSEFATGHVPGAVSAPGGQLVQATDLYAGTLGARIVVADDKQVRALMSASWLRQMGWAEVYVLEADAARFSETGTPAGPVLGTLPADKAIDVSTILEIDDVTIIDLSPSPAYHRGHIPGAWFAIRGRLDKALHNITNEVPLRKVLVLSSADGVAAGLAVAELEGLTEIPVRWLEGGNAAWAAAGIPLSTDAKLADEPLDVWLKPYERKGDPKAGMQEYLSWEVDLLERIKQDGTTHFISAR
ncbi:MAG: thiosulfate sulfurtransferase [Rhodopseudomonas sp.]|nr:thiosulfate sulfurtransferase [Rhodopseudomonas sp.]